MEKRQSLKTLTVIVPARNEQAQIANTVQGAFSSFKKFSVTGKVIVVDDGSTDDTGIILSSLSQKYSDLKVIRHKNSKGIGAAFLSGFQEANTDYVFLLPGDNENDPDSVMAHFDKVGENDVLISYVVNPETRSFFRQILSRTYTFLINFTFRYNLKYFNGTSIYKVSTLKTLSIQNTGFFFTAEILIKMLAKNKKYIEVPIKLTNLRQNKTSAISWKSLKEVSSGFLAMIKWQYGSSAKDEI